MPDRASARPAMTLVCSCCRTPDSKPALPVRRSAVISVQPGLLVFDAAPSPLAIGSWVMSIARPARGGSRPAWESARDQSCGSVPAIACPAPRPLDQRGDVQPPAIKPSDPAAPASSGCPRRASAYVAVDTAHQPQTLHAGRMVRIARRPRVIPKTSACRVRLGRWYLPVMSWRSATARPWRALLLENRSPA